MRVTVALALALVAGRARAEEERALLAIAETTEQTVIDAVVIELQLAGAFVIVQRVPSGADGWAEAVALAAPADAATLVTITDDATGAVVRVRVRDAYAEGRIAGATTATGARAIALVAAGLLERASTSSASGPSRMAQRGARESGAAEDALTPRAATDAPESDALVEGPAADVFESSDTADEPLETSTDEAEALAPPALRLRAPSARALGDPHLVVDDAHAANARAARRAPTHEVARPLPVEARIAIELGLAAAGAAILGIPAALVANAAQPAGDETPYWIYASATAATLGVGLGVALGGLLSGARGDPFWTVLAAIAGGAIGGAFMALGAAVDRRPGDGVDPGFTLVGYIATVALPPLLGIATFELTGT